MHIHNTTVVLSFSEYKLEQRLVAHFILCDAYPKLKYLDIIQTKTRKKRSHYSSKFGYVLPPAPFWHVLHWLISATPLRLARIGLRFVPDMVQ